METQVEKKVTKVTKVIRKHKSPVKKNNGNFITPAVTFIPTVTYPMVEQWFKTFYHGEYGEMIFDRIIKFYKYVYNVAPTADIIYIVKPHVSNLNINLLPQETLDYYHMMSDFGTEKMELCMIDPFELEEELKDEFYKRF